MMFTCCSTKSMFYTPLDVRGKSPCPRWGHSFVALSGCNGRAGFLTGGRNRRGVLSDTFILSYKNSRSPSLRTRHFIWEKVNIDMPRFYHHSSLIPGNIIDIDTIIIFGGLEKSNDILQTFSLFTLEKKK